jgi:hypothetical protein
MTRTASTTAVVTALLVVAALLAGGAFGGGGPPPVTDLIPPPYPPSITGIGTATVRVAPAGERTERAISRVVAQAHQRAIPGAFAAARAEALRHARAAGVELGAVQHVTPTAMAAYNYWWGAPSQAPFEGGRWCGSERVRRGSAVRRRICRRPHRESVTLTVAFDIKR